MFADETPPVEAEVKKRSNGLEQNVWEKRDLRISKYVNSLFSHYNNAGTPNFAFHEDVIYFLICSCYQRCYCCYCLKRFIAKNAVKMSICLKYLQAFNLKLEDTKKEIMWIFT